MANVLSDFFQKKSMSSYARSWIARIPILKKMVKKYRIPYMILCQSPLWGLMRWISVGSFVTNSFKKSVSSFAQKAQNTQVWFDHMWKGGTEQYTYNEFSRMKKDCLCIRIQNNGAKYYLMTCYFDEIVVKTCFIDMPELVNYLKTLPINVLVLNNLAGYQNPTYVLEAIAEIKAAVGAKCSYKAHDFQSFCPRFHMVNDENVFCDCRDFSQCIRCAENEKTDNVHDIVSLQQAWRNFLECCADEIVVFSVSSQELIERFYPFLGPKILVIPHYSAPLRKANIEAHKGINIGILGSIGILKGSQIVDSMARCLDKFPQCSLVIIGEFFGEEKEKVKVIGRYEKEKLPEILENQHIDIIFVPSILPETFSYTTAEAMSMGLPVACFSLGAPAERVAQYDKGLVIDVMDGEYSLRMLVEWYTAQYN